MSEWKHGGLLRFERDGVVHYSVVFTWLLPVLKRIIEQGDLFCGGPAVVGGPAVKLMPHYLDGVPGVQYGGDLPHMLQAHNPLATRTTRGCPNHCSYCAVPTTEGCMVE